MSFWPFNTDANSAELFERVLSQLSVKINKSSTQHDQSRSRQRRYKALWTLYSSFAYILVVLILILVTGWEQWRAAEYTAVSAGPVVIYVVRSTLDAYYNYRITKTQHTLDELYKQRATAIDKLKAATKYNSTQQLLDKYGGTPKQNQESPQPAKKRRLEGPQSHQRIPQDSRTAFVPPPTANIPGRQPPAGPHATPDGVVSMGPSDAAGPPWQGPVKVSPGEPGEEFAPNAFATPMPPPSRPPPSRQLPAQYATEGPAWYDRLLEVILGEDETDAKNRIALICSECRLVNGQAPPGVKTPDDLGKWRCSACHAMNGVDSMERKMLRQISSDAVPHSLEVKASKMDSASPEGKAEAHSDSSSDEPDTASPANSTRTKSRRGKKA